MFKKLIFAGLVTLGVVSVAYAAGLFQGYPIAGGPSYCNSLVNGVCNQTIAAGPATTGSELIPADTRLPNGQNPQTVLVPITVLRGGLTTLATPLTGASITTTAQTSKLLLNPAGTIAALTIVLPAGSTLIDGQTLDVGSSQIVTALTLTSGTGTSIVGGPTTIAAPGGFTLAYKASSATEGTWYRLN